MYQSFDINILILYTTLTEELHIIPWSESYTSLLVLTTTTGEQIPRYNMDVWRGERMEKSGGQSLQWYVKNKFMNDFVVIY